MAVYRATKTAASVAWIAAVNSSTVGLSVIVAGSLPLLYGSCIERVLVDLLVGIYSVNLWCVCHWFTIWTLG